MDSDDGEHEDALPIPKTSKLSVDNDVSLHLASQSVSLIDHISSLPEYNPVVRLERVKTVSSVSLLEHITSLPEYNPVVQLSRVKSFVAVVSLYCD